MLGINMLIFLQWRWQKRSIFTSLLWCLTSLCNLVSIILSLVKLCSCRYQGSPKKKKKDQEESKHLHMSQVCTLCCLLQEGTKVPSIDYLSFHIPKAFFCLQICSSLLVAMAIKLHQTKWFGCYFQMLRKQYVDKVEKLGLFSNEWTAKSHLCWNWRQLTLWTVFLYLE